jgi:hypothetical protein
VKYIYISISFLISMASFGSELQPERWAYDQTYWSNSNDCGKFDIQSVEDASRCRREILKRKVAYQRKLRTLHEEREQLFWDSMNPAEAEEIRAIMSGDRDDELE